jgi:hypothetical protein
MGLKTVATIALASMALLLTAAAPASAMPTGQTGSGYAKTYLAPYTYGTTFVQTSCDWILCGYANAPTAWANASDGQFSLSVESAAYILEGSSIWATAEFYQVLAEVPETGFYTVSWVWSVPFGAGGSSLCLPAAGDSFSGTWVLINTNVIDETTDSFLSNGGIVNSIWGFSTTCFFPLYTYLGAPYITGNATFYLESGQSYLFDAQMEVGAESVGLGIAAAAAAASVGVPGDGGLGYSIPAYLMMIGVGYDG